MPNDPVLVDTSAWLFALKKDFLPEIKDRVALLLGENRILTTGIIRLELLGGTRSEVEYDRLNNHLSGLETIETDESLWDMACETGFKLRRRGITVPYMDILISACALSRGCRVLHADNHFDLIAEHISLKCDSFVEAVRKMKNRRD